ncbi:MAG: PAS domain S-box protein [Rhodocyclales bacterium]|nr:PAS domain S-box protein [Rhodocyclales bacterium]
MSSIQAYAGGRSIRTQLNLLALAAVLPLFLAFTYDIYREAQSVFERARGDAQRLARVSAADAQGYFARTEQRLGDISRRVEVGSLDPARCKSLFADIETIHREYAGLAMVDRDGRLVCLAGGEPDQSIEGLTAARPLLALAEGQPRLLVGAPVKGGAAGRWVLPLAYPVRGGDGRAAGMVMAAAQLDRFQSLVATLNLPEQPTSFIVKGEGLVVVSSHEPDRHVGQNRRDDALTRAIVKQRSGVLRGASVDGVERIYGFHPVAGTDWLAVIGLDVAPIREAVIASAIRHGAYGLGVLALALILSFTLGRRISAPITALARSAHAFGEGRRDARVAVSGAREVAEVAVQLNRMFGILAERERSLVETQEMLDSLLESMDRVLWSFAPDMSAVFFASESSKKLFGHEAAAFRANPRLWLELAHPDDRKQAEAMMDRIALSGAGVMEYRIVRPDGETRWIEVRWRHAAEGLGKPARLDGIVTDITERRQAEDENRQLLAIVEQSLNEIYVFDATTLRYEYANSGALHNLGYSFRHLRLLTPLDLMPQYTEGALLRLIEQLLNREKAQQVFETAHRRSDGSEYPAEVHLQAVEREGRWKCLAVVIDISERQHAQTEIMKLASSLERRVAERTAELARTNAELESFVYSISHDLRTPLRAINGYATILAEEQKDRLEADSLEMLKRIARGAVRMGDLIDDLLTFSRVGRTGLNRMQVDVEAMARTVVEELHHMNPLAQVAIQALPMTMADPALLRQVMLNLIGNALKFTSRRSDARVEVGMIQEGGLPVYFIRDNGAGFDPGHAGKLFGVFQRLHQESEFPGTGVGLAIVKRIIERHNGRVWAEAATGKGATFYFTLP